VDLGPLERSRFLNSVSITFISEPLQGSRIIQVSLTRAKTTLRFSHKPQVWNARGLFYLLAHTRFCECNLTAGEPDASPIPQHCSNDDPTRSCCGLGSRKYGEERVPPPCRGKDLSLSPLRRLACANQIACLNDFVYEHAGRACPFGERNRHRSIGLRCLPDTAPSLDLEGREMLPKATAVPGSLADAKDQVTAGPCDTQQLIQGARRRMSGGEYTGTHCRDEARIGEVERLTEDLVAEISIDPALTCSGEHPIRDVDADKMTVPHDGKDLTHDAGPAPHRHSLMLTKPYPQSEIPLRLTEQDAVWGAHTLPREGIRPGETIQLSFVAREPGSYVLACGRYAHFIEGHWIGLDIKDGVDHAMAVISRDFVDYAGRP
jgi:hypothetical protein